MKKMFLAILLCIVVQINSRPKEEIGPLGNRLLRLDYEGFTIWLDCAERAPVKFRYNAKRDEGDAKRYKKFLLDPDVPENCQQYTSKSYGNGYDRGHQVPANHLDFSEKAIMQSNFMTNILPQTTQMNRGAWLLTEEITECYRDIEELLVLGGVIWGNDTENDLFVQSHGVRTPDAFWKLIIRGSSAGEKVIAWIVPNTKDASKKNLDKYISTVEEIEKLTGDKLPVADFNRSVKPQTSWIIPMGCNKG